MIVKATVLDRQYRKFRKEYQNAAIEVLESGWYILGKYGERFEQEFAEYIGTKYCVGRADSGNKSFRYWRGR